MSPATTDSVVAAVTALPGERFAVVDGALVDGLTAKLAAWGISGVALYLEAGEPTAVESGPFLAALPSEAKLRSLLRLVGEDAAPVFWSWPAGFLALRRHLRTLNVVEIPNEDRKDEDQPAHETVIFRHWDPNVLAPLLPVLTAGQRSRFLGRSEALVFDASDYSGLVSAHRPEALPPAPRGMLRFTPEQMAALGARREEASRRRIAEYLREVAPQHTARMSDPELAAAVLRYEKEAKDFGLATERDIGRWAFLEVMGGGMLAQNQAVRDAFRVPYAAASPTACLERMFAEVEARLRLAH